MQISVRGSNRHQVGLDKVNLRSDPVCPRSCELRMAHYIPKVCSGFTFLDGIHGAAKLHPAQSVGPVALLT
jgi:hypothetical protein